MEPPNEIDVTSPAFRSLPAAERIRLLRRKANPYDTPRNWEPNPYKKTTSKENKNGK
jgi:hypothetical protein